MLIFFWFQGNDAPVVDTHDGGFWRREYEKMLEWATKPKPTLEEVVELVKEQPEEAVEAVKEQVAIKLPNLDINRLNANIEAQKIIARLIIKKFYEKERAEIEDHNRRMLLLI